MPSLGFTRVTSASNDPLEYQQAAARVPVPGLMLSRTSVWFAPAQQQFAWLLGVTLCT